MWIEISGGALLVVLALAVRLGRCRHLDTVLVGRGESAIRRCVNPTCGREFPSLYSQVGTRPVEKFNGYDKGIQAEALRRRRAVEGLEGKHARVEAEAAKIVEPRPGPRAVGLR